MIRKRMSVKEREDMDNSNSVFNRIIKEELVQNNEVEATKENSSLSTKTIVKNSQDFTEIRKLKMGSNTFKVKYEKNDTIKRAAYHLHGDTINKVEICSKAAGMKKAEFVDHILNAILTEIIEKTK